MTPDISILSISKRWLQGVTRDALVDTRTVQRNEQAGCSSELIESEEILLNVVRTSLISNHRYVIPYRIATSRIDMFYDLAAEQQVTATFWRKESHSETITRVQRAISESRVATSSRQSTPTNRRWLIQREWANAHYSFEKPRTPRDRHSRQKEPEDEGVKERWHERNEISKASRRRTKATRRYRAVVIQAKIASYAFYERQNQLKSSPALDEGQFLPMRALSRTCARYICLTRSALPSRNNGNNGIHLAGLPSACERDHGTKRKRLERMSRWDETRKRNRCNAR